MTRLMLTFVVAIFLLSCRTRENHVQLREIMQSLENSNVRVQDDCEALYKSIEEKVKDPVTNHRAEIWRPKAMAIRKLSQDVMSYMETLKTKLKKDAGTKTIDTFDAANLEQKLIAFKTQSLKELLRPFSSDSLWMSSIKANIARLVPTLPLGSNTNGLRLKSYFPGEDTLNTLLILTKLQNDLLLTEHALVKYAFRQIPIPCGLGYEKYSALTFLNSSYLKNGQTLEVTAGMGEMTLVNKPVIVIDGKVIAAGVEGTATRSFTLNKKPGEYYVPIEITFTGSDGMKLMVRRKLEYVVAE